MRESSPHAQRKGNRMTQDTERLTRILNDLVSACNNSWEGFGKAAKGVHNDDLRNWFTDISAQRLHFSNILADEITRLGGQPAQAGSAGGILHAGWVDLEARIRPKDDASFRENCADGEESTIKHYEKALETGMPAELRTIIERQLHAIRSTVDQLRSASPAAHSAG